VSFLHLYSKESVKKRWGDCRLCNRGTTGCAATSVDGAVDDTLLCAVGDRWLYYALGNCRLHAWTLRRDPRWNRGTRNDYVILEPSDDCERDGNGDSDGDYVQR